jgi:hypothetical protein
MSMYKCSACDFKSDYKSNVVKHINKTKKCANVDTFEVIKLNVEIRCDYCDKEFSDKNGKNRHLKICKFKPNDKSRIKELEDKVAELSGKLSSATIHPTNITKNSNNTTHNTTHNNTTNNTINNYITISLTPYNDPNMEGMQQYLEAAIRKTFLSVPSLIENIHFNDEYPENQNICITNKRTKDAKVFDGKKWKTINKDLLLNEMVDTYERELTNFAEEQGNTKYIKNYESAMKRGNAEKDLVDEVHNIIYDNSEKVNTKVKEVQKPIRRSETQEKLLNELDQESIHDTDQSETESNEPPADEYDEFQKKFNDDDSEQESEPELESD